jgi:hypothetical protein
MQAGDKIMAMIGHGWAICGEVAEVFSPFQYSLRNCSVICRTGGTAWDDLARGRGRDGATFRRWAGPDETVEIATGFTLARKWEGELP